jgi:hypothetical protein
MNSVEGSESISGSHDGEHSDLVGALGLGKSTVTAGGGGEEEMTELLYDIVPDHNAENVDLSTLRGVGVAKRKRKRRLTSSITVTRI